MSKPQKLTEIASYANVLQRLERLEAEIRQEEERLVKLDTTQSFDIAARAKAWLSGTILARPPKKNVEQVEETKENLAVLREARRLLTEEVAAEKQKAAREFCKAWQDEHKRKVLAIAVALDATVKAQQDLDELVKFVHKQAGGQTGWHEIALDPHFLHQLRGKAGDFRRLANHYAETGNVLMG